MQLKPLKEYLAMTKETLDATLAPLRARAAKAKAEQLLVNLDLKQIEFEKKLTELVTAKDIDFEKVADLLDDAALNEHRRTQFESIVKQLFPEA